MDALLARYFDGDLSENEAREFLEAVQSDPVLDKELRAYEHILSLGKRLSTPRVPAGFTERVMQSINAVPQRKAAWAMPAWIRTQWAGVAFATAAVVLAFVAGVWTNQARDRAPRSADTVRPSAEAALTIASSLSPAGTTAAGSGLRYVRLVYVPSHPGVLNVAVAGSFNNWSPTETPLQPQGGVWSTILVLPPGSYEYMFIEDGNRWVTDPLAVRTRDDGFGSQNAVLDVEL